jgi:hypothetical protein
VIALQSTVVMVGLFGGILPQIFDADDKTDDFVRYLSTWSAYHTWKKQNPDKLDLLECFHARCRVIVID